MGENYNLRIFSFLKRKDYYFYKNPSPQKTKQNSQSNIDLYTSLDFITQVCFQNKFEINQVSRLFGFNLSLIFHASGTGVFIGFIRIMTIAC